MNSRRRLALALVGFPAAFYAYACSSQSAGDESLKPESGSNATVPPGAEPIGEGSSNPPQGGSSGSNVTDAGASTDARSDSEAPVACAGNPLTADGKTADGGANVGAAALQDVVPKSDAYLFLDGPQWVEANGGGFLAYSEVAPTPRLLRVGENGGATTTLRTAALSDNLVPTGNAFRNGVIFTLASDTTGGKASKLLSTALDGGAGAELALGSELLSPNDLVFGAGGTAYVTDPRYQATVTPSPTGIFAISPGGGTPKGFASFEGGEKPNGIALSPDGSKLYVAFTAPKRIDSFPVAADGKVTPVATSVVTSAKLTDAPDGLAIDASGNLYVAEAAADVNGNPDGENGRVEVFSPAGETWGQIQTPGARPTGVAFGGADKKSLFIVYEKGIRVYRGRCVGLPQN